ncbi:MAG: thioredoxin [Planctomycetaceae bacterium]|nr:thioredoxin [Planctomycetaceae bacterium]
MRSTIFLAATAVTLCWVATAQAVDPYAGVDPYWILLHEPDVIDELKLDSDQRPSYQKLLDELDLRFFRCRNQSVKVAQAEMAAVVLDAREKLKTILKSSQNHRLTEILLWRTGTAALLREDVATQMQYSETQRKRVKEIVTETQAAVTAVEQEASTGKPREPLEKKYRELKADEQRQLTKLLKPEQRTTWNELLGKPFDLAKLGRPSFKAPELLDSGDWINSVPLTLAKSRGKVVVLHFYACGCINCIHNYPSYLEWDERYRGKDVLLIGIHTPETESERNSANVRQKAAAAKFAFPVLIDTKSENWNAWGNSMWPSVYIIDQRGYVRYFWPGELKWQGNDGEKYLREQIEKLLAEK